MAAEILDRVGQLNTFNQHRFRSDPGELAGWEAVRNVPGPFRSIGKLLVEGGTTPPSGEVAPAA